MNKLTRVWRPQKKDIIPFAFLFNCRSKEGKTVQEVNGARTEWLQWVADAEISRMHLSTRTKPERRAWNGEKGACRSWMGISFHSTSKFQSLSKHDEVPCKELLNVYNIVKLTKGKCLFVFWTPPTTRSHLVLFVHQYPHWFVQRLWARWAVGVSVGPQSSRSSYRNSFC